MKMKKIISIRKSVPRGSRVDQFIRGNERTIKTKILNMIKADPNGVYSDGMPVYDFYVVDEKGKKRIKNAKELSGQTVKVMDDNTFFKFVEKGDNITIQKVDIVKESLPQSSTVNQLKRIRKITKGVDIGDKISDMNKQGANIQYIQNPIDTGIE